MVAFERHTILMINSMGPCGPIVFEVIEVQFSLMSDHETRFARSKRIISRSKEYRERPKYEIRTICLAN